VNRPLYWLDNVAKCRIVDEVLAASPGPAPVTIFDYGCGRGGDWRRILTDHPHLRLIGYEPHGPSVALARDSVHGLPAEIHTGDAIETLNAPADIIVSFSVFEHVVDRAKFLAHAKRLLKPGGVFYLNYDDGHFRNRLDLADATTWLPSLRAFARTVISVPSAALGRQDKYQRRVPAAEADRLVADAGFRIERVNYHNLLDLNELIKTMPPTLREDYARWWLDAEQTLNARFRVDLPKSRYGDTVNLWRQMVTRTLLLRHA
jgi:SAM-dependent methyltransferase